MRNRLILVVILIFWSCILSGQQRLNVVASASMIADIASNIIGDIHNINMIVPIGGDPHLHEPTPSNARMVASADLILINGLTFEGWITELIDNSGTSADIITVTEGIDVLTSQTYKNSADPHAWMAAANGVTYARNIFKAISSLDPKNKQQYQKHLEDYESQLNALDREIREEIQSIPEMQRILITSHDAFQYYGRRYGIQLEAIMGISTEAEAQTSDILRVNKVIKEQGVPAIFIESTINPKLIEQLAHDNKISVGGKLYADSLGDKNSPAATYIDMLRYNTKTIVAALKQSETSLSRSSESKINYFFIVSLVLVLFAGLGVVIFLMNK